MFPNGYQPALSLLQDFRNLLADDVVSGDVAGLRAGLIGEGARMDSPFGEKALVYADYVASGRALMQVERFVLENILPYYANSHTEASFCGATMTGLRRDARAAIAAACHADAQHAVIFAGSGATNGLNRLVNLLGVSAACASGKKARVIIGPYEHHSNILPWRESGAQIVEIPDCPQGGPNLTALRDELAKSDEYALTICAFSAASNVTGIVTDVAAVTKLCKAAGAKTVWDYAGAGPYVPIHMTPAPDAAIDAIVVSPHKFIGGPAASGLLIIRRDAVTTDKPTWPGGGTVSFVSPWGHDYSKNIEAREESGTPNVVGDIRSALSIIVKDVIGADFMTARNSHLARLAIDRLTAMPNVELLGSHTAPRLPIFSFRVKNPNGGYIHQQLVTRMLSDRFGIQVRGGCACAGPYVHRLLEIDEPHSDDLRNRLRAGEEVLKPGFTRFNLSVLMSDEKIEYILNSIAQLAQDASSFVDRYQVDESRAIFSPKAA